MSDTPLIFTLRKFGSREAETITGVSQERQRNWKRQGIILQDQSGHARYDLVGLYELRVLREFKEAGIAISVFEDGDRSTSLGHMAQMISELLAARTFQRNFSVIQGSKEPIAEIALEWHRKKYPDLSGMNYGPDFYSSAFVIDEICRFFGWPIVSGADAMIISENPYPSTNNSDEFFDEVDWLHFAALPDPLLPNRQRDERPIGEVLRDLDVAGHTLARVFLLNGIIKETVEKAVSPLASFRLAENDED